MEELLKEIIKRIEDLQITLNTEVINIKDKIDKLSFEFKAWKNR